MSCFHFRLFVCCSEMTEEQKRDASAKQIKLLNTHKAPT